MASLTVWFAFALFLVSLEVAYFKIADRFDIIDKPNHRSSHTDITIRGGGIIFAVALFICPLFFGLRYPLFLSGLFLIALISFIDDIKSVANTTRVIIQLAAAVLLIIQLKLFSYPAYYLCLTLFLIIGSINAVNFMDGINGITGTYALVALCTLYYFNLDIKFTDSNYLLSSILAVIVFNFFNFRKKAKCFAGDVGSVSIAFIIIFFLTQLILKTQNIGYIFLLLIYGLDTGTTIIFRVIRKEKITQAHRSHFYQYLANERRYPHLFVAVIYGLTQLLINIALFNLWVLNLQGFIIIFASSLIIFISIRFFLEGKNKLLIGENH